MDSKIDNGDNIFTNYGKIVVYVKKLFVTAQGMILIFLFSSIEK